MNTEATDENRRKRVRTDGPDELDAMENTSRPSPAQPLLSAEPLPAPKRVACVQCRQSKLRCDSPKDPCSRCERLDLPCMKDKGYRRFNKRSKIDELEKVVMQLQARVGDSPTAPPFVPWAGPQVSQETSGPPGGMNTASQGIYNRSPGIPVNLGAVMLPHHDSPIVATAHSRVPDSRSPATKARAIDSTALGTNEIDGLFNSYFDHFHPFFPLLNPTRSPDMYYERSPLVFWVVISVAARRYPRDASLQSTLAKTVLELAWKVIADPPLVYPSVQGILILCMWPPSIIHLWSDASTSLSNIAMIGAMHMGLHRPEHAKEFTRNPKTGGNPIISEGDNLERKKTWAACNIVSQYTIVNVGYPPTSSCFDWSIERACEPNNPYSVSDELRYHLIIQRFCYRTSKAMSENISDPLGLPSDDQHDLVMRILEHDLATLEGQLAGKLSLSDKLSLHGARLHLELHYWLGRVWTDQKRKGILKSYATSVAMITEFVSANESFQVLSYGPITLPRLLFNASYIILRVLNSSLSEWVDVETGTAMFHSGIVCMMRYSCQDMDITARAASILSDVWNNRDELFATAKHTEPSLSSRSRLAGSMTFDCLWRWKEKYPDKRVGIGNYRPVNSWAKSEGEPQGAPTTETYDPIASNFDWALFDDFDWPWTFDGPSTIET